MNKKPSFFISNLANNITILRIFLVPAFVCCLMYYSPEKSYFRGVAILVFIIACATDALDGFVARKLGQRTDFGSYIDPIADKLLLMSGFLSLSFMSNLPEQMRIPAWVTITVISRDVVIVIGSTLIFLSKGALKAKPLLVGKITTVAQMATLCGLLFYVPEPFKHGLFMLTASLTLLSAFFYVRIGEKAFQNGGGP